VKIWNFGTDGDFGSHFSIQRPLKRSPLELTFTLIEMIISKKERLSVRVFLLA